MIKILITCANFFKFQAKPKLTQLKKYGNPKSRAVLHEQNIQLFGRQILEVSKSFAEISIF